MTLDDGRTLVRKEVSPAWDWISRATRDDGRVVRMWERGLFDRMPRAMDHATVGAERVGDGWAVFMRDVSPHLVAPDRRLDRAEVRRVLAALHEMHVAWAEDPAPLGRLLQACEPTLIHGDVRLNNLGLAGDRVVLVDWGERTGIAPAPVELASFLVFDARRLDVARDDVLADYRAISGERFDERALELALIGGLVQLGGNFVLPIALGGGDEARARAEEELAWWTPRVAAALERWSPV